MKGVTPDFSGLVSDYEGDDSDQHICDE